MSRVGKKPINIPDKVQIKIDNNVVMVEGPKGKLAQAINPDIEVSVEDKELVVKRPSEQKKHKAMHGLYRALINNMVQGVTEGYKIELEIVGVGFKAVANNDVLELNLGYSHSIFFALPKEIKATAVTEKGKSPIITLESIDKQLLGQVVAKIKSLRPVEPYKGKGIRTKGEVIRRKAGKAAAKK